MIEKGIILAGGHGSRLYPVTKGVNKHLLPVYNKPVIYYPLTLLMQLGIKEILVICHLADLKNYQAVLGNGSQWAIRIHYKTQAKPMGIYHNIQCAADFIQQEPVFLLLGDNVFLGQGIVKTLQQLAKQTVGAGLVTCQVKWPQDYGVVRYNDKNEIDCIVEKPQRFISHSVVTGLYCYDQALMTIINAVSSSKREHYNITDLNNTYIAHKRVLVHGLPAAVQWFDIGRAQALLAASQAVAEQEALQGTLYGSPDLAAYQLRYIDDKQLLQRARLCLDSDYGQMLAQSVSATIDSILD